MDSCSDSIVNSLLAFDINLQEWRRVASMSSKRSYPGVGVLNNLLYAVNRYLLHFSIYYTLHLIQLYRWEVMIIHQSLCF